MKIKMYNLNKVCPLCKNRSQRQQLRPPPADDPVTLRHLVTGYEHLLPE